MARKAKSGVGRFRDYVRKLELDDPYLLNTAGYVHRDGDELQEVSVRDEVLVTEVLGLVVLMSQDQGEVLGMCR